MLVRVNSCNHNDDIDFVVLDFIVEHLEFVKSLVRIRIKFGLESFYRSFKVKNVNVMMMILGESSDRIK